MPRSRPYAIQPAAEAIAQRPLPPRPDELTASQSARRQRIVAAGLELLSSADYEQVQVRDVAQAAGVALGTVYRYFPSKEHLFATVLLAWQTQLIEAATATSSSRKRAPSLTDIVFESIRSFQEHPSFYKILVLAARTADPSVREVAESLRKQSDEALRGPLEGFSDDDRGIVVMVLGAVLETALGSWLKGEISAPDVYTRVGRVIEMLHLPNDRAIRSRRTTQH